MRSAALAALLLASAGCMHAHHAPPPPPAGSVVSEQQAVDLAADYARSRGLQVDRTTRASIDGKLRWHVELAGPTSHAQVVVDGTSGRILHAKLRQGPPPPPPPQPPPAAGPPPGAPAQAPDHPGQRSDDWDE
jgi:hypothetical protein